MINNNREETAPSDSLRKWFAHDPAKWDEFKKRYFQELEDNKEAVLAIKEKVKERTVTLVYGAKDIEHNNLNQILKGFQNR